MMTKKRIHGGEVVQICILWIVTLIFLFPFLISVLMALKSKQDTAKGILTWPSHIEWSNFTQAIEKANIFASMRNSIVVTVLAVVVTLFASSMAGYAIARNYKNKHFKFYEALMIAAQMIPFQSLMIPIYKMYKQLGWMNTIPGAALLIGAMNMPFAIMMIIGFVRSLPIELEEAAELEGCNRFQIFFKIIFPLLRPVLATVTILDALWTWNEVNISILILQKNEVKTIPLQQYVFFGEHSADYNMAFAAAIISMIPIVIFFIVAQKNIIAGMTAGAVKG